MRTIMPLDSYEMVGSSLLPGDMGGIQAIDRPSGCPLNFTFNEEHGMRFTKLLLLTGLFLALAATAGLAEDAAQKAEKPAEYTLGEIVVKDSASTLEKSTTVTEISADELKNSGAITLADALKLVPGVTTRTAADGTCRIDIRGMRTRQVKLLLNGMPILSTYDGQFDPDTIPVENIARIKITQGATSVLYGDGGTAGVIDIITKKGTQETHGSVGAMAGQGDQYRVSGTVSGGSDKFDFYAGTSWTTRNGYPVSYYFDKTDYQDVDMRKNSDREHINFLTNMTYKATDSTNIGGTINYFQGSYGKPPVATNDSYSKSIKYERVDYYDGIGAQLALDHDFDGPVDTRVMVYGSRQYTEENRYDDANYSSQVKKNSYRSRATSTTMGLNNQWGYDTDNIGRFVLGLIGEHQNYRETGFTLPANNTFADLKTDRSVQLYTVALQDDVSPFKDFELSLGTSLVAQSRDSETPTSYDYVIAGNYQIVEGTNLKASHARRTRFPSITNLYDSTAGNTDLDPEVTWHYEAGITQALPLASTLGVTVFRLDSENYIEKDSSDVYQNNEKYQFRGAEITLKSLLMDNFTTNFGYTYMESENLSDDADFSVLQYRPKHKATAEATYITSFGTTLYGSFRYFADQFAFDKNETEYKRTPDYAIVDVKVSQSITEALSVYVGADNLTDTDYYESYGFPRPGRTIYTGLDYTF